MGIVPRIGGTIGGSKKSQHSKGEAIDLEIDGVSNMEVADWITENLILTSDFRIL